MTRRVLILDGREVAFEAERTGPDLLRVRLDGDGEDRPVEVRLEHLAEGAYRLFFEGKAVRVRSAADPKGEGIFLVAEGASFQARPVDSRPRGSPGMHGGASHTAAPVPGIVRRILVAPGDAVKKGQVVALMEAVKMECPVAAGRDGTVTRILAQVGKTVDAGTELVEIQ